MGGFTARLLQAAALTARAGAQTYAAYQPGPLPKKGRRKGGCTPCAAMAAVDKARKMAGTQPVEGS